MEYKNILVIGAHGKVGKRIVTYLSQYGYNVYAMIREEVQKDEMEQLGAIAVLADLEKDFKHVYKNMDAIIFTAGSGSKTGPDKTITVDRDGALKSIELAESYGISRYIMVSAQGAREPEVPSKIQHYYQAKSIADNRLQVSGLKYTIFRPGRLLDDEGNRKITISLNHLERGLTSRDNLARSIVETINNKATFGKTIELLEGDTELVKAFEEIGSGR